MSKLTNLLFVVFFLLLLMPFLWGIGWLNIAYSDVDISGFAVHTQQGGLLGVWIGIPFWLCYFQSLKMTSTLRIGALALVMGINLMAWKPGESILFGMIMRLIALSGQLALCVICLRSRQQEHVNHP